MTIEPISIEVLTEHFDTHEAANVLRSSVTAETAPACAVHLLLDYAWELKRQFFDESSQRWLSDSACCDHLLTIATIRALQQGFRRPQGHG
jgi:hypothetical protein